MQISDAFQKPSLTTVSLTLSFVTATGSSSTDGTSFMPLSISPLTRSAGGSSPCDERDRELAAASASGLIAL